MLGTLYIVATPIGNLEDITLRAIRILSEVDIILAEDTRVTHKLLEFVNSKLQITNNKSTNNGPQSTDHGSHSKALLLSYHQHSSDAKKLEILKLLMDGKNIALVTDAGTPGISDPGNELISFLITHNPELKTIPVPGPSAITTALSVSGFDASKFLFLGFWPKKKAKKVIELIKFLAKPDLPVAGTKTFVFYESPFRIIKTLGLLRKEFGDNLNIVVAQELTKMYEKVFRGPVNKVIEHLEIEQKELGRVKGEIVVILNTIPYFFHEY